MNRIEIVIGDDGNDFRSERNFRAKISLIAVRADLEFGDGIII